MASTSREQVLREHALEGDEGEGGWVAAKPLHGRDRGKDRAGKDRAGKDKAGKGQAGRVQGGKPQANKPHVSKAPSSKPAVPDRATDAPVSLNGDVLLGAAVVKARRLAGHVLS